MLVGRKGMESKVVDGVDLGTAVQIHSLVTISKQQR